MPKIFSSFAKATAVMYFRNTTQPALRFSYSARIYPNNESRPCPTNTFGNNYDENRRRPGKRSSALA